MPPPYRPGEPTMVRAAIHFTRVLDICSDAQTFSAEFTLNFEWKDDAFVAFLDRRADVG